MKNIALAFMVAITFIGPLACARGAAKAADKLTREDLLDLQVTGMQMEQLQQKAQELIAPLAKHRDEVLKRYDIVQGDDIKPDGTIVRHKQAAPADMGTTKKGK